MAQRTVTWPGHIGGTSARDVPGSVENSQDLSRRPGGLPGASAEVRNALAQDPAASCTRPLFKPHLQSRLEFADHGCHDWCWGIYVAAVDNYCCSRRRRAQPKLSLVRYVPSPKSSCPSATGPPISGVPALAVMTELENWTITEMPSISVFATVTPWGPPPSESFQASTTSQSSGSISTSGPRIRLMISVAAGLAASARRSRSRCAFSVRSSAEA
jgi:hypothetical protein